MNKISVLIVEDERPIRDSLSAFFEDCGFTTITAIDAEAALAMMDKERVDAAIVDMRLPGMRGVDFIEIAHKHHPHMAFLLHTGSPEFETPSDLSHLDCVSKQIFIKPVHDLDILADEIKKMVAKLADNKIKNQKKG